MTNLTNDLIRQALSIYDDIIAGIVSDEDRSSLGTTKKIDNLMGFMLDSFPPCARYPSDSNWKEDLNTMTRIFWGDENDPSENYKENLSRRLREIPPSINPNVLGFAFLRDLLYNRHVSLHTKEMTNMDRFTQVYQGLIIGAIYGDILGCK